MSVDITPGTGELVSPDYAIVESRNPQREISIPESVLKQLDRAAAAWALDEEHRTLGEIVEGIAKSTDL